MPFSNTSNCMSAASKLLHFHVERVRENGERRKQFLNSKLIHSYRYSFPYMLRCMPFTTYLQFMQKSFGYVLLKSFTPSRLAGFCRMARWNQVVFNLPSLNFVLRVRSRCMVFDIIRKIFIGNLQFNISQN